MTSVRWVSMGVAAVLSMALAGCSDFGSPQGVLGTAFSALKKEKVKTFKRTLTGEALEKYGNLVGMGELAAEIQGQDLSLGTIVLKSVEKNARGHDVRRVYSVEVLSRDLTGQSLKTGTFRRFKDATVECKISYVRQWNGDWANCDVVGPRPGFCSRPYPGQFTTEQVVDCRIASLDSVKIGE